MAIRSIVIAVFAAVSLVAGAPLAQAQGQGGGGGASYKIGVVDMQRVIAEYNKREAKYQQLQSQVDALQKDIDALSAKIEANKKKFEASTNAEERSTLKSQIDTDYITYRAELEKRQQQIDTQEEQVLKEVLGDVQKTLESVAKAGNYHLILNGRGGGGGRSAVLYHDTTIDITSQVLDALNRAQ